MTTERKTDLTLSRRGLMQGAAALGLGLTAGGLWLPKGALAAGPKRGGSIVAGISHGSTSDSTVPGTYSHGLGILLSYTIHARLTTVVPDNKLEGNLAESWEGSEGATKWKITLRDAEFHNGKKVTPADVIASINFHRTPDTTSVAKETVSNIKDIAADGDKVVVFTLNSGDADFPFLLNDYQLCIGQADADGAIDWEDDGRRAGPYRLTEYDPGIRAVVERADNYWNSNVGFLDRAEILTIADPTARQNALLAGEVDVIDRPDTRALDIITANPELKVEEAPGFRFYGFTVFTDVAPYSDQDFRLALKYAVDREALLDVALNGHGIVGNDQPITPAYRYYNPNIPQRQHDPDKAKFHLKKSGYDGAALDLSTSVATFSTAVDAAALYQANLAQVGINVNVVNEPADSYWSDVWLKKPFITTDWGGRPTEDMFFSVAFQKDAPWNDSHFNNERFEKLLVEARAELDEAKRAEMYGEMQQIVHDEGGSITPLIPNNVWARSTRIKHGEALSTAYELDGWHFISRWWVEEA
ncbi:ABC transporter substrate-binding protein [Paracoccus aminophilus]|uniref:ABC-type dipeptide/oligopeptide/nickel transport system, substrate binding component n=1 Tax=Paracoccus aminophilus JCM 7686 TaxID=1367847 RepID=S5YGT0_PARAH|nr:ABC transporter substrate-binding protein [Paracoccus aminophilus]AGT10673.1 ABC-type dipeptide/oligopeptide/nickel transport system, substrate binding component [Paracoccus aminophilus JCM 7686]